MKFLVNIITLYLCLEVFIRLLFLCLSIKEASMLELASTLAIGVAYDLNTALFLLLPLALFVFLSSNKFINGVYGRKIIKAMLGVFCVVLAFTSISEYYFWDEFHTRFNFIAVDYLVYTQELFGNIFQSYNIPMLIIGLILIAYIIYKLILKNSLVFDACKWSQKLWAIAAYSLILVGITTVLTSSFKEHVIKNKFNQEIAGNGLYQFVFAFFHNELDYDRFYKGLDENLIEAKIRNRIALTGNKFTNKSGITRFIDNNNQITGIKPNIVFIVVESLSARYTGMDGNKDSLTPKLDYLASRGFAFNNVYATGTRTVRGLEAVSLNVPPTPGQSIVRREDCANLYNLGTALRKEGYKTEFIYGGYGYFDNMNAFFEGNKFEVIDRTSIPKEEIIQETVWGVADEILFNQCIKQLDKHHKNQESVLQVVLTTTNHRPFTFPEGRIDAPQGKRESVVKYTDWAIDNFINKAREKAWFDNTVFVVIADHNALAAGKVDLPISNYKIRKYDTRYTILSYRIY